MITSNDFKKGMTIKVDGELFTVIDYQHIKQARGGAIVKAKVKKVKTGSVLEKAFRGGEKVEDVRLEKRPMQYLYDEGDSLVFMDTETYEQLSVPKEAIGNALAYLKEEDIVAISMYEEEILTVEPPLTVVLKVTYAEPGLKGDTATNVLKPVKVETGAEVKVPLFVNEGDYIKINTETGSYVERVQK